MNYLTSMGNLLRFSPFKAEAGHGIKQLQLYCIFNVLALGLIYGCSAALFSRTALVEKGLDATAASILPVIVAGIPVAFFMHAGAALFIWVFLKAMGGKADFMTAYFHIGAASISLWPLAPFVAVLQLGTNAPLLILLAAMFSLYAFAVNVRVIKSVFRLSTLRMTLATSLTLVYISCFLYLWV